jgi:hypothetical protein
VCQRLKGESFCTAASISFEIIPFSVKRLDI